MSNEIVHRAMAIIGDDVMKDPLQVGEMITTTIATNLYTDWVVVLKYFYCLYYNGAEIFSFGIFLLFSRTLN